MCAFNLFFFLMFMYYHVLARQRENCFFHFLVYSPSVLTNQSYPGPHPGVQNSILVFHISGKNHVLEPSSAVLSDSKQSSWVLNHNFGIAYKHPRQRQPVMPQ